MKTWISVARNAWSNSARKALLVILSGGLLLSVSASAVALTLENQAAGKAQYYLVGFQPANGQSVVCHTAGAVRGEKTDNYIPRDRCQAHAHTGHYFIRVSTTAYRGAKQIHQPCSPSVFVIKRGRIAQSVLTVKPLAGRYDRFQCQLSHP